MDLLEGSLLQEHMQFRVLVTLPPGSHSQTDKTGFWAASGVPVSRCACCCSEPDLQPQCWCSTAETLLQTVWSFRGGKRSPVSLSLPSQDSPSFISQATISQECLHTDLTSICSKPHSYPRPRDQTGSVGSLSDYFLIAQIRSLSYSIFSGLCAL